MQSTGFRCCGSALLPAEAARCSWAALRGEAGHCVGAHGADGGEDGLIHTLMAGQAAWVCTGGNGRVRLRLPCWQAESCAGALRSKVLVGANLKHCSAETVGGCPMP